MGDMSCVFMAWMMIWTMRVLHTAARLGYSGDLSDNASLLSFLQSQSAVSIVKGKTGPF